jgi:thiol-disulfide isomerase/thioredoxin
MIAKFKKGLFFIFILFLGVMIFTPVFSQESPPASKLEINFFYSKSCPFCAAEQEFLDSLEKKYPEIKINRYIHTDPEVRKLLVDLYKEHNADKYIGLVPMTFVGKDFFLGFDSPEGIGKKIEESIQRQLSSPNKPSEEKQELKLPIIGKIDLTKYSLLLQAVVLGFFDGFNFCSLGALILILGLVLILRSRTKILIFGSAYILTTVIVYGILIFLWYQVFYFLAPYLKLIRIFVGLLGILGGVYFIRQFIRMKKYGPTCDMNNGKGVVAKFSSKVQKNFEESGGIRAILISIFIFAVVITIVEFPCSAVIPVLFASILAHAHIPALLYLLYIVIYLLFYMLDEIIIFLIAFFTMTIKITSSRAMIWLALFEAIVLFGLGIYYLFGL